jgi:hypothetical protein
MGGWNILLVILHINYMANQMMDSQTSMLTKFSRFAIYSLMPMIQFALVIGENIHYSQLPSDCKFILSSLLGFHEILLVSLGLSCFGLVLNAVCFSE